VGESHVFGLRYPDGTESEITIESTSLTIQPVNVVDIIEQGSRNVGYLHFNSFGPRTGEAQLIDAFETFENAEIDDLVLDLRYNGGGLLFLSAQLGYMIAGTQSSNRIFYSQEFNSRDPQRNPINGDRVSPINFKLAHGLVGKRQVSSPLIIVEQLLSPYISGALMPTDLVIMMAVLRPEK